jgi:hypothetical protein
MLPLVLVGGDAAVVKKVHARGSLELFRNSVAASRKANATNARDD